MAYEIQVNRQNHRVEARYWDRVDAEELHRAFGEIVACTKASQIWHVLLDLSAMTGGHTLFDLHAIGKQLAGLPLSPRFREAIVLPRSPDLATHAEFWQSFCRANDFKVRNFGDRESAEAWLQSQY